MKKNIVALVIGIALAFGIAFGCAGCNNEVEEINDPKEEYVEVYMGPEEGWVEVPKWLVVEVEMN